MAGRESIRSKTCMLGMQSLDANFGSRFWILKVSLHPPLPSALRGDGEGVHVQVHILPDPLGWFGIGKLRVFDLKRLKIFSLHYVSYFSVSFCIFLSLVALEKKQTGASFGWSLCTSSPCWEAGKGDVEVRVVSAVKGLVRVVLCCAEGPRVGLGTWRLLLSG